MEDFKDRIPQPPCQEEWAGEESDMDIMAILRRLWDKRKFILIVLGAFALVGLLNALIEKPQYTSSCTFVPQFSSPGQAMAMMPMASFLTNGSAIESILSGDTMSPLVYPQLLNDVDFNKELMQIPLHFRKYPGTVTLYELNTNPKYREGVFLSNVKKYTIGLPGTILDKLKPKEPDVILPADGKKEISMYSKAEYNVAKEMSKMIKMEVDKKEFYYTLSATVKDPLAAAELCQATLELMQRYITDFKLKRARINLEYTRERYEEAKADYEEKQLSLARFSDANRGALTATAKIRQEQLSSDYQLSYSIFSDLSRKLLQSEMSVKEDTPIFSTVESVSVPLKKSNSRIKTLFIWLFLGLFAGCGAVIAIDWMKGKGLNWPEGWY